MFGSITGDIIGSVYESDLLKLGYKIACPSCVAIKMKLIKAGNSD
jgi:hypothetical protein